MNTKGVKPPYKNFERNQRKILEVYEEIVGVTGDTPSFKELADKTGLSINTIYRHFKKIDFNYICARTRIHTPAVMEVLAEKAKSGSSRDRKLFLQVIENVILKTKEEKKVLGDLKVNSEVSGELKVVVERRVITSREDLEKLKNSPESEPAPVADDEVSIRSIETPQAPGVVGSATAKLLLGENRELDII